MKLYQKIARALQAMENCKDEYQEKHNNTILEIERDYFPHGSGIDADCFVDIDRSTKDKIIIVFDYDPHPKDHYGKWLTLDLIITPELSFGFNSKIVWYSHNNDRYTIQKYKPLIEAYLYDIWNEVLNREFKEF